MNLYKNLGESVCPTGKLSIVIMEQIYDEYFVTDSDTSAHRIEDKINNVQTKPPLQDILLNGLMNKQIR